MHIVLIEYKNGSNSVKIFKTYSEAMDFARDGISYSGGKIAQVSLLEAGRVLWAAHWDATSKAAGLRSAP